MQEQRILSWTVIQFIDDDGTVEAVPSSWIRGEFCHWPTYSKEKVLAAIKNCEPLNTCWPCHRVKTFRNATYGDYLKARSKAKLAEDTSDLNTGDDENTMNQYKRKRTPKVLSSSEESDEEDIGTVLPPTPKLKKSFNVSTSVKSIVPSPVNSKTLPNKEPSEVCSGCSGNDENFKTMFKQNHVLRGLLTDTLTELRLLRQELNEHPRPPPTQHDILFGGGIGFTFPITNDEEFQTLENYLEDAEKFSNMVSELSALGGSSAYDAVKRTMSLLLTNEQAVKFSWCGRKGKRPFLNLNVAKVLIKSIEKLGISPSRKITEVAIQTWLRRATDRLKAAMLKKI